MNDASAAPATFEHKLERIDTIVKELEGNRVELDRALELFKEGKRLARECKEILDRAQEQVDRAMTDTPNA